jgi:hypothetical protein
MDTPGRGARHQARKEIRACHSNGESVTAIPRIHSLRRMPKMKTPGMDQKSMFSSVPGVVYSTACWRLR